jgi:macrolide transport system ATP-binding/permease protein
MFKEWLTKFRYLLSSKRSREIDEELRFHIERQTQAYV